MVFIPTTVEQLNTQVQNALANPPSYPEGQPDTWDLSSITDWYSTNPLPFTLAQLRNIGMTPTQLKVIWSQMGGDIDGEANYDYSGTSVSLSDDGTIMAIGAYLNDGNGSSSGHVRVFEWKEFTQSMVNQYHYSNQTQNTSDQTKSLIITSKDTDGNYIAPIVGQSYWTQLGIDIDGEVAGDRSGYSVSLSGNGTIVAISATRNNGTNGNYSGHVRVYQYDGTAWIQLGEDIDGEAEYDQSGYSVSLSDDGSIVAIGANYNDGTNGTDSGHVRVYQYDGTAWTQLGGDIDGEALGDESGFSVSLSSNGKIVAIGAYKNDGTNGTNSGHVRVYQYDDVAKSWSQLGGAIDGEAADDQSGYSVSLSGDGTIVAIGALFNDGNTGNSADNRGHVRVYQYDGSAWNQLGNDIDGEAAGDYSGYSVSLSGNGKIVAIGAVGNDGNSGNDSGHVRVFEYKEFTQSMVNQYYYRNQTQDSNQTKLLIITPNNDVPIIGNSYWTQMGTDLDGEADYDYSGRSVSLSSDGTIVAIGARQNNGNSGNSSGHVRVYQYGYSLTELKAADFTAAELKAYFTLAELKAADFTAAELKAADFTAAELKAVGFNLSEVINASFPFTQILEAGYSISVTQLETAPLKTLGYTATELASVGFNASQLKTLDYSSEQLNASIFDVAQLIAAGYTLTNLIDNGILLSDLVKSFTLDQLKAVFTLAELKAAFTLVELKAEFTLAELKAEFKLTDLKTAGFILDELKAVGFILAELKAAGFILDELKDKFTLAELKTAFTLAELKDKFILTDLKNGGINAAELHEVGYSFDQLRVAGFSAADCRNGGMSNRELPTSGFSIKQLRIGGLSATRMRSAGYSAKQLYENGYAVSYLFEADYSASEIRLAGVDALKARFGGISNKEMRTAGYTVKEYKDAYYQASRMKEAGYTRKELEGVYSKEELDAAGY